MRLEDFDAALKRRDPRLVNLDRLQVQFADELLRLDLRLEYFEMREFGFQFCLEDKGARLESFDRCRVAHDLRLEDLDPEVQRKLCRFKSALSDLRGVGNQAGFHLPGLLEGELPIALFELGLLHHHVAGQGHIAVHRRLRSLGQRNLHRSGRPGEPASREAADDIARLPEQCAGFPVAPALPDGVLDGRRDPGRCAIDTLQQPRLERREQVGRVGRFGEGELLEARRQRNLLQHGAERWQVDHRHVRDDDRLHVGHVRDDQRRGFRQNDRIQFRIARGRGRDVARQRLIEIERRQGRGEVRRVADREIHD